jgi:carbonic anhydrase
MTDDAGEKGKKAILGHLLENNRQWADKIKAEQPDFFETLSKQQNPEYLWIGCSDSRVPANEIVGLMPGELFVHRNVANVVGHTDMNCLSVIQYAVEILKVKHIIVCGHYGCGGVKAATTESAIGLIDNWIRSIKDTYYHNRTKFKHIVNEEERVNFLCELNVKEQVSNVAHTTIVQNAWLRGQELSVSGWVYGLKDGVVKDLDVCVSNIEQVHSAYRME